MFVEGLTIDESRKEQEGAGQHCLAPSLFGQESITSLYSGSFRIGLYGCSVVLTSGHQKEKQGSRTSVRLPC